MMRAPKYRGNAEVTGNVIVGGDVVVDGHITIKDGTKDVNVLEVLNRMEAELSLLRGKVARLENGD